MVLQLTNSSNEQSDATVDAKLLYTKKTHEPSLMSSVGTLKWQRDT
jgi:hypothetical protein